MSLGINTDEVLGYIAGAVRAEDQRLFRLGTIDPAYSSGQPKVTWDGEGAVTTKDYVHLSSYAPKAGERVLAARVGRTWVVLGRLGTPALIAADTPPASPTVGDIWLDTAGT